MSKPLAYVLMLVTFGLGAGAGTLGLLWATGGVSAPSRAADEVAPTLSLSQSTPTPAAIEMLATEVVAANAKLDTLSTQVGNLDTLATAVEELGAAAVLLGTATSVDTPATATSVPTEEATETAEQTAEAQADTASAEATPERALFRIDPEQSEARFKISETFFGQDTTVVGTTSRVAGDVIINYADPAASQIGTIAINARTFKTDQDFRDQSIRGRILESSREEYEFINFTPTEIRSLATNVSVGDTVTFEVVGDLTIKDTTRQVVFNTTVTADALDQISGLAATEIAYADYGITVNPPPNVANVGETVVLELEFVAAQVESE